MKTKLLFYMLLLSCAAGTLHAQDAVFDSLLTAGIKQIYNIEYNSAENTFDRIEKQYPSHPAGNFFSAMIIWWKIMMDTQDEKYDELFEEKLESTIDFCDLLLDENENNADALFFKGGALGFRGLLASLRQDWLSAASDGTDALPLVNSVYELEPDRVDVQLGFGLYNYFSIALQEQYPVIKPLMIFIPEGNKEQGLAQLETVINNGKYAATEAKYTLMKILYLYEKKYSKALSLASELMDEFPANPVFKRYFGRITIASAGYYRAFPIFKLIWNNCLAGEIGYSKRIQREASYYIGMKYKGDFYADSALTYFAECEKISREIDETEDSGFLINSVLYQGMMHDLTGNRSEAVKKYNVVLDLPEYGTAQEKADKYLKMPYSAKGQIIKR